MIDIQFSQSDCAFADREHETLQQYVRAMLARQQALDLLETIHQQINHVWVVIRQLLDGMGVTTRTDRVVRAAQARNTYNSLEKRREECIAALHEAECRANTALHNMLDANPQLSSRKTSAYTQLSRAKSHEPLVCRPTRRKLKNALSGRC
jgi:hypothetical protein